jgi:NADH:ubiquinone oxidoreductase subunit 2 (subunit N)
MPELDLCFGLLMVILYGLFSLRHKNVYLADVFFFCRTWPLLLMVSYMADGAVWDDLGTKGIFYAPGIDVLLCLLTFVILHSFKSFESILLLMMAYVGQLFMLHSCDLVSFYVCLEAQNFCFLVLCGLQPGTNIKIAVDTNIKKAVNTSNNVTYSSGSAVFSVEASIKYLVLSAFSSGVILFWFAALYLRTGMSALFFKSASSSVEFSAQIESFMILLAMMFKLGAAPLHLWVVDIYGGVKRQLLMYMSTAPKLSLFGFWVSSWHQVWTSYSVALFVVFSLVLGSFGAYGQPALRTLLAYSTISEIGILLMAIETAGFHSLFQHLGIYIVTQ